jgi:hypothetical protein
VTDWRDRSPGGLIVDPFIGSRPAGVAGIHEGIPFLGIGRHAGYVFDIAAHRLPHAAGTDTWSA